MTAKFLMIVSFAFYCTGLWAIAQANAPVGLVRATLSDAAQGGPWVGQKVTLVVELLAPGYFSGAPQFTFPDIPGVILVPPQGRPLLSTEDIGGQSYTVQRHEVLLYARRPGPVEIPSFKIQFAYKAAPLDQTPQTQEVYTPKLGFVAKLPPGAENLGALICSSSLTVSEQWHPEPKTAKVGDAFVRTIQFRAADVPGMALLPFPAEKISGIGIYRKSPIVEDQADGGTLTGLRRERITYVCEESGQFTIPAVTMTWFNLDKQSLEKIELPQYELHVTQNPEMPSTQAHAQGKGIAGMTTRRILALFLSVTILVVGFLFSWKWISPAFAFLRPVHLTSLNPTSR